MEEGGGGVANIDVVGMVQAASQRCHSDSDVHCDCHEAHQCHLVKRKKMDVLEDCIGVGVAM
jgi:hypothetical protein